MPPQMLTANRLNDGAVVFLAHDGRWAPRIGEARVIIDEGEATMLLQAAESAKTAVVAPYLIEVAEQADGWIPVRYRERIRAEGPSIAAHPHVAAREI
jgi:Protein of unknown function (DUF2849)